MPLYDLETYLETRRPPDMQGSGDKKPVCLVINNLTATLASKIRRSIGQKREGQQKSLINWIWMRIHAERMTTLQETFHTYLGSYKDRRNELTFQVAQFCSEQQTTKLLRTSSSIHTSRPRHLEPPKGTSDLAQPCAWNKVMPLLSSSLGRYLLLRVSGNMRAGNDLAQIKLEFVHSHALGSFKDSFASLTRVLSETDRVIIESSRTLIHMLPAFLRNEDFRRFFRRGGMFWCLEMGYKFLQRKTDCFPELIKHFDAPYRPEGRKNNTSEPEAVGEESPEKEGLQGPSLETMIESYWEQVIDAIAQDRFEKLNTLMLLRTESLWFFEQRKHVEHLVSREQQIKALLRDLEKNLDKASTLLSSLVPSQVPFELRKKWSWKKIDHLTLFLFGGKLTMSTEEANVEQRGGTYSGNHSSNHAIVGLAYYANTLHHLRPSYLQSCKSSMKLENAGSKVNEEDISTFFSSKKPFPSFRILTYDLETTGLDILTDRIVEIAVYDPLRKRSFTTLINPQMPIPPRVSQIHGLTDESVKDAPLWNDVGLRFIKFLAEDKPFEEIFLLSHNGRKCDEPLLLRQLREIEQTLPFSVHLIDSIPLLRFARQYQHHLTLSSFRLSALLEELEITSDGTLHRAFADAKGLWDVMCHLSSDYISEHPIDKQTESRPGGTEGKERDQTKGQESSPPESPTQGHTEGVESDRAFKNGGTGCPFERNPLFHPLLSTYARETGADFEVGIKMSQLLWFMGRSFETSSPFCFASPPIFTEMREGNPGSTISVDFPGQISPESEAWENSESQRQEVQRLYDRWSQESTQPCCWGLYSTFLTWVVG